LFKSELPGTVRRIAWAYKKFKDIEDPALAVGSEMRCRGGAPTAIKTNYELNCAR